MFGAAYIVDVSILTIAAKSLRVGYISKIKEDETGTAAAISRRRSDGNGIVELLVDNDIVAASQRKIREVSSQISLGQLNGCSSRIDCEKLSCGLVDEVIVYQWASTYLAHVVNLDAGALQFATNEHVVFVGTNFLPECVSC